MREDRMLRCSKQASDPILKAVLPLLFAALIGGCSVFGDDGPDGEYPNLAEVPARPQVAPLEEQDAIASGLRADQRAARYSEAPLAQSAAAGSAPPPPSAPTATQLAAPNAPPAASTASAPQTTQPAAPPVGTVPQARSLSATPPVPAAGPPAAASVTTGAGAAAPVSANVAAAASANPSVVVNPISYVGAPSVGAPAGAIPATVVYFDHGSSGLTSAEAAKIGQVVAYRNQVGGGTFRLIGHASMRTGNIDMAQRNTANLEVSWARANMVADALRRQGVPPEAIMISAVADTQPIYAEVMPLGEAGNRRVEIYLE